MEPYWCAQPCVILDNGKWMMWYLSCTKWQVINGRTEPFYLVKYAESSDGILWRPTNHECLGYDEFTNAIGRPCVLTENGIYKMLYSYRSAKGYRTDQKQSYRLGYAESVNGINWVRKDEEVGINRSKRGWDAEMICYCHICEHKGRKYLLYNGNGFGRSGFGYAILEKP